MIPFKTEEKQAQEDYVTSPETLNKHNSYYFILVLFEWITKMLNLDNNGIPSHKIVHNEYCNAIIDKEKLIL